MTTIRTFGAAALLPVLLAGCLGAVSQPDLTPLQKREIQSRSYMQSKPTVFRSTMAVLQDHGYTIRDADLATGHIAAESATNTQFVLFAGNRTTQRRATAFVERIADRTVVRMSFVDAKELLTGYGKTNERGDPIWDPEVYRVFFEALETAIFLRE